MCTIGSCSHPHTHTLQLLSAPLARKLSDIARGMVSQMIEVARVLGEKRLCKLAIACPGGTVEVYCLEQEKLMDALQQVKVQHCVVLQKMVCWCIIYDFFFLCCLEISARDSQFSLGSLLDGRLTTCAEYRNVNP